MSEQIWMHWTPQYDGHAPDDWDGGETQFLSGVAGCWISDVPVWNEGNKYRYRSKIDTLATQCLALPQADRDALIEALQKPQRDWADDVWVAMMAAGNRADGDEERAQFHESGKVLCDRVADAEKAVIRSMCRPKEDTKSFEKTLHAAWEEYRTTDEVPRALFERVCRKYFGGSQCLTTP